MEEIEETWQGLRDATVECAQHSIGRCGRKRSKQWIQGRSWKLIDERKIAKLK
uniref:Uncharacterized protein n=1 Tax=Romanomermis culicivorax TaxID=13658 RepID=A0A915JHD5_ROMCU